MNQVILTGRLTRDIELRYTANNNAVARFTLAVDRANDSADFVSCQAWSKTAELLNKYCSKGSKIALSGRIQTGSYQKDDKTVYTTDVIAERVEFMDARKQETKTDEWSPADDQPPAAFTEQVELDSDVPF